MQKTRVDFSGISSEGRGALAMFFSLMMWGLLPIYWKWLDKVSPFEILAQRLVWSFLLLLGYLLVAGTLKSTLQACRSRQTVLILVCTSLLIAANWLLYIWAVTSGNVLETSLGYYINPLMSILLGRIMFGDKPSRLAWLGIVIASIGLIHEVVGMVTVPYIAFGLGITFAFYGALRKIVAIEALPGLFVETVILLPVAMVYLAWLALEGQNAFLSGNFDLKLLLIFTGPATTFPLVLFAYGARNLRLTVVGIMQYISPSMTFLLGIFVFHESVSTARLITFCCVWLGLIIYTIDMVIQRRAVKK